MTKAKGATTQAKAATKHPPKRRTDYQINVKGNTEFRELDDGTWEAYFATLDVRVTAESREAVGQALIQGIEDAYKAGDDELKQRWQDFCQNNIIEVEISEEEYRQQQAERRKQKRYPSSGLPQLTPKTFDKKIASSTPTLVDYWAPWCEPCHAMAPVLHELKDKLAGQLDVCAVDVEKHEPLWERFDLKGIPTLIVFKDGEEVQRILGTRSLDELLAELEPVLA